MRIRWKEKYYELGIFVLLLSNRGKAKDFCENDIVQDKNGGDLGLGESLGLGYTCVDLLSIFGKLLSCSITTPIFLFLALTLVSGPLRIPKVRTKTYGEASFSFYGPCLWSSLPENQRATGTVHDFKRTF